MEVKCDNVAAAHNGDGVDTISVPITVGNHANRALVVVVGWEKSTDGIGVYGVWHEELDQDGVIIGTEKKFDSNKDGLSMFYVLNPPVGTNTVHVWTTGNTQGDINCSNFYI
jgi:hypothetical protein